MVEKKSEDIIQCIEFYSGLRQEVDTPCARMLRELGVHGVDAVVKLMRDSVRDDELVAGFCIDLLANSGLPGSVEALTDMLARSVDSATLPDESLEELFDDAIQYDRFLTDSQFLSTARQLSKRWNNTQLDRFLAAAEQRLKVKVK